jgi:hypothetical protein
MVMRAAWLAACAVIVTAATADAQAPKPKPKPRPATAAPRTGGGDAATSRSQPRPSGKILITVDDDAMVTIDGRPPVAYKAGQVETVTVDLGTHIVRATSARASGVASEQEVQIEKDGQQQIARFALKTAAAVVGGLTARRNLSTAARDVGVVIVVDPPLATAAAALAPSLLPQRIWLQSPTGDPIGPRTPDLSSLLHVELTLQQDGQAGGIGGPGTGGGAKDAAAGGAGSGATTSEMQSCQVVVGMAVYRAGVPASYSYPASGAAFGAAQACSTARQRAVTSAINALTAMVRKELR